jgi:hypothetical protein
MSVNEYVTKFTQLSRYAPHEVDTDEKKNECFLNGLNDGLAYALDAIEADIMLWPHASCSDRCRLGLAEDAASLRARPVRSLRPPDGSPRGTPADFSATTRFAASVPC